MPDKHPEKRRVTAWLGIPLAASSPAKPGALANICEDSCPECRPRGDAASGGTRLSGPAAKSG